MDELIGLLIVIGIAAISSSRKKKKAQKKAAQQARSFKNAAESLSEAAKPISREVLAQFMPELADEVFPEEDSAEAEIKPAGAGAKIRPAQPQVKAKPAPVQLKMAIPPTKPMLKPAAKRQPAPVLFMDHDEPEGSVSTQGESPEEHAMHLKRIHAEEEKMRTEHESLQEIRDMNLQKLRAAVVMSEILDKPVSLRRRRTY